MDFSTTLAAVRSMDLNDRIRLVQAIWDEIAADQAGLDLTEAQKQELDNRLSDDDANPTEGIPWEVIREEARSRSQRRAFQSFFTVPLARNSMRPMLGTKNNGPVWVEEFSERVHEVLNSIATFPEIHQCIYKDVRRAVVRRFPYLILYRIKPSRVRVIAVFHSRRNPAIWQARAWTAVHLSS